MQELWIMKGIQASGKSTEAKRKVDEGNGTWVRVNKDSLRVMLHGGFYGDHEREDFIHKTARWLVRHSLRAGLSVVSDDMNFGKNVKELCAIANEIDPNINIEVKFFDTPLEECLRRNALRTGHDYIPEEAIVRTWERYINNGKPATT